MNNEAKAGTAGGGAAAATTAAAKAEAAETVGTATAATGATVGAAGADAIGATAGTTTTAAIRATAGAAAGAASAAAAEAGMRPLLQVRDLHTHFFTDTGIVKAVNGVSFDLARGERLAIVGESGSGKSAMAMSLIQLIAYPGKLVSGSVKLDGKELVGLGEPELNKLRGGDVGTVFQDPMSSLDPVMRIEDQMVTPIRMHLKLSAKEARRHAVELLERVGIPGAEKRISSYPFEMSGGMRQRIMIAMSLACNPKLILADEPTTALDVTIQAQIVELLKNLTETTGSAMMFITHDLGLVARFAQKVAVMYAGKIVEYGTVGDIFASPKHPYTQSLLMTIPSVSGEKRRRLLQIQGFPPDMKLPVVGCSYKERCPAASERCYRDSPELTEREGGQSAACWLENGLMTEGYEDIAAMLDRGVGGLQFKPPGIRPAASAADEQSEPPVARLVGSAAGEPAAWPGARSAAEATGQAEPPGAPADASEREQTGEAGAPDAAQGSVPASWVGAKADTGLVPGGAIAIGKALADGVDAPGRSADGPDIAAGASSGNAAVEAASAPFGNGAAEAAGASPGNAAVEAAGAASSAGMSDADVVLRITDLRKHFRKKPLLPWKEATEIRAVGGISFELRRGETIGIVGESGCGKSTTARMLLKLDEPTGGRIEMNGSTQIVFQDPYSSFNPKMKIADIIAEPLNVRRIGTREERRQRVRELIQKVGLDYSYLERYPSQLSGGQRQRVGVARALALNPSVVVADEPTSALDVSVRAQIINLLCDLKEELGLSFVFISHDLSTVRYISDTIAVMYLGEIVEYGPAEDIFVRPAHPYTKALLAAVPVPDPRIEAARTVPLLKGELPSPANPPAGCAFSSRCPLATAVCAERKPALAGYLERREVACHAVS